jgi:hypothetical protein
MKKREGKAGRLGMLVGIVSNTHDPHAFFLEYKSPGNKK